MLRRTFVAGMAAVVVAPRTAQAQQTGKGLYVAYLSYNAREPDALYETFRKTLYDFGYSEGRDLTIDFVWLGARVDESEAIARQIIAKQPNVVVVPNTAAATLIRRLTDTIPIVVAGGGRLLDRNLVHSHAKPGGNVTGLSIVQSDLAAKRLQLLREIAPHISHAVVLVPPGGGPNAHAEQLRESQIAGRRLGMSVSVQRLMDFSDGLDTIFDDIARRRDTALVVVANPLMFINRARITERALQRRLITVYEFREFVEAGGLISYGVNLPAVWARAAGFVDKILKGAKPGELPIEEPATFELSINSKTARTLGLTIPPSLLLRADQVIE